MKFKVGDRVKIIKSNFDGKSDMGNEATIVSFMKDSKAYDVEVEFDKVYPFTHGGNTYEKFNKRWHAFDEIALINESKIVITIEGNKVIAKKYNGDKVVKTTEAKCSPEDTFDFDIGAKLACERLFDDSIKVNDKVKVVNRGAICSLYSEWVEKNITDPNYKYKWDYKGTVRNGSIGQVIAIAPHAGIYGKRLMAYIKVDDKCYLINIDGLEKC